MSSRLAKKIDTSETSINIDELIPGVTYELVIKAGNSNGTSQLTPPIKFITADKYIIEAKGWSMSYLWLAPWVTLSYRPVK